MVSTRFGQPVRVLVGLGYPLEIGSVAEAHAFLGEWPQSRRDAAHALALKACKAALAEETDAGPARAAFAAFANRHHIGTLQGNDLVAGRATGALSDRPAA